MASEEDLENLSPEEIAEYQKQNCIFCKIVKGEIPSRKVYEDDKIISILDINPAVKGHLLVLTKEHYPILPVIPLDTQAHMFRVTKHLVKAMKQGMIVNKATVFIANGAIAGQQSPHFLYHLIPRDDNDGLDNFSIPAKELKEEEVLQFLSPLKGKIGLMMREYRIRRGKPSGNVAGVDQAMPMNQEGLAKFIDSNPKIKEIITNQPEDFKKEVEINPQLKRMFSGININKLSAALASMKK